MNSPRSTKTRFPLYLLFFLQQFNNNLLNICYVPDVVLRITDITVNKTDQKIFKIPDLLKITFQYFLRICYLYIFYFYALYPTHEQISSVLPLKYTQTLTTSHCLHSYHTWSNFSFHYPSRILAVPLAFNLPLPLPTPPPLHMHTHVLAVY